MSTKRNVIYPLTIIGFCVFILVLAGLFVSSVFAVDYPKLENRSLLINDVSPGVSTNYTLSWRYPSPTTIGSVRLLLCDNAVIEDPCINPGSDFSSATLDSQSGVTGFSIMSQSAGEILLSRAPSGASTVQSAYELGSVVNPAGLQRKIFIRILTYPTVDGTGSFNHASSVVNATTEPIVINGEVPQILYFCAALTISDWCATSSGNFVDYGTLDPINGHSTTSQFGVATNALGGYTVIVSGDTMTSGNKTIAQNLTPNPYTSGVAQFGINLRANTTPALGQDVYGGGTGTVATDYNTPDLFKYTDGDIVASAVSGTLFNTYTVTYIVNVPPDLPSGIYNTTIAYICTAAF